MRTDIHIMDLYVAKNVLRDLVCQKNKEKTNKGKQNETEKTKTKNSKI